MTIIQDSVEHLLWICQIKITDFLCEEWSVARCCWDEMMEPCYNIRTNTKQNWVKVSHETFGALKHEWITSRTQLQSVYVMHSPKRESDVERCWDHKIHTAQVHWWVIQVIQSVHWPGQYVLWRQFLMPIPFGNQMLIIIAREQFYKLHSFIGFHSSSIFQFSSSKEQFTHSNSFSIQKSINKILNFSIKKQLIMFSKFNYINF